MESESVGGGVKAVAGSEDCCWWDECHRVEHAELGGINVMNSRVSTTGIFTVVFLLIPFVSLTRKIKPFFPRRLVSNCAYPRCCKALSAVASFDFNLKCIV